MLVFEERGKAEYPEKNLTEHQQQTQPTYDAGSGNRSRDTLVEGERSHHGAIPAPPLGKDKTMHAASREHVDMSTLVRACDCSVTEVPLEISVNSR